MPNPLISNSENGISKIIRNNLKDLENPDCLFFASWTTKDLEGRITNVWKKDGENDEKKIRLVKIWSFIFPETREEYLIEKIWDWMYVKKKSEYSLYIHFCDECDDENQENKIHIKSNFITRLKGEELRNKIKEKFSDNPLIKDDFGPDLKIARTLKYNKEFNQIQIRGINEGFSTWISPDDGEKYQNTKKSLNILFEKLCETENGQPASNPLIARSYLTMWQNISVIFPNFKHVFFQFYIPNNEDNIEKKQRFVLALFFKKKHAPTDQIEMHSRKIIKKIIQKKDKSQKKRGSPLSSKENDCDSAWDEVLENKKYKQTWKTAIGDNNEGEKTNKLKNVMRLAGRLALVTHEGRPCKFAYIAGTELIWPAVEEIISLRFYCQQDVFSARLFSNLCEANYSIFQIEDVVGFYNTELQSLSKIIRLRSPTKEEMRKLEDPICDLDDLFRWSITEIFKKTKEECFIISTQGNGKVSIYGLNPNEKQADNQADSLLIWDVRKGELEEPIPKEKIEDIKKVIESIGIDEKSNQYKKLVNTIRKISAIPGDGACLIISESNTKIKKYLTSMELLLPTWLDTLSLDDPQYMLRASFVMDGACLVNKSKILPRQTIYPHYKGKTWGLVDIINDSRFVGKKDYITKMQSGKGSKTHASANISTHPQFSKDPKIAVISISADGPIKIWPQEFLDKKR